MEKKEPASQIEEHSASEGGHEEQNIPKQNIGTGSGSLVSFVIQFLVVAVLFFAIGFVLGQRGIEVKSRGIVPNINITGQTSSQQDVDFSLFWEVFNTLPKTYFDKSAIDGQKMMYGAISGMVRSLGDPYSAFLDPEQNKNVKGDLSGEYEGVGIQLGFDREKRLVVLAPLKGTPAENAGIRAKDVILKIDERETYDITLPEAVKLIRGAQGTRVKLQLFREGDDEPFEKTLERAKIEVKTVEVAYRQTPKGEVAIIEVARYGDKTDGEWDAAVSEVVGKGVFGIIVDVRNNPGGLLASCVHMAEEFVSGTIVRQEFSDGSEEKLAASRTGKLSKVPLVVLVNEGSASAAEIFAGAIQDKKRGKIVGATTFGKGSVQDAIEFAGGAGMHITIARWLTPDGNSIHDVGIKPDVEVELTQDDTNNERDPQLDKALNLL